MKAFTFNHLPPRNRDRDATNRAFVPVTETARGRSVDKLVAMVWLGVLVGLLVAVGWI